MSGARANRGALSRLASLAAAVSLAAAAPCEGAESVRVKDLGRLQGWRENALVGFGIVTGLAGTGDSPTNRSTRQALSNVFSQFNLTMPVDQVQSRNVAVVMVSASLPPLAREGDPLDVNITSVGDARSLLGGELLLTPLKGPNGRVYALASGPLLVGGYRYDANGNIVQKNHPTLGSVPGGATVEVGVRGQLLDAKHGLTFVLSDADHVTATRMAQAINAKLGQHLARAEDASAVEIQVPEDRRVELAAFVASIEAVEVEPDRRAKVVINERTGTVVSGGDVTISEVTIAHGDLKVSIIHDNAASQPSHVYRTGPGVRTAIVTNTRIDVDEVHGPAFVKPGHDTVADLVQALANLKISTRDIISILRAMKTAGALHAELVVQ
jgi:flagellar P-ring protein precursor FlgI